MPDIMLAAGAAVMWSVKLPLHIVQHDPDAGAVGVVHLGPKVIEQGFHFPPVDVAAHGVRVDGFEKSFVFVTHSGSVGVGAP